MVTMKTIIVILLTLNAYSLPLLPEKGEFSDSGQTNVEAFGTYKWGLHSDFHCDRRDQAKDNSNLKALFNSANKFNCNQHKTSDLDKFCMCIDTITTDDNNKLVHKDFHKILVTSLEYTAAAEFYVLKNGKEYLNEFSLARGVYSTIGNGTKLCVEVPKDKTRFDLVPKTVISNEHNKPERVKEYKNKYKKFKKALADAMRDSQLKLNEIAKSNKEKTLDITSQLSAFKKLKESHADYYQFFEKEISSYVNNTLNDRARQEKGYRDSEEDITSNIDSMAIASAEKSCDIKDDFFKEHAKIAQDDALRWYNQMITDPKKNINHIVENMMKALHWKKKLLTKHHKPEDKPLEDQFYLMDYVADKGLCLLVRNQLDTKELLQELPKEKRDKVKDSSSRAQALTKQKKELLSQRADKLREKAIYEAELAELDNTQFKTEEKKEEVKSELIQAINNIAKDLGDIDEKINTADNLIQKENEFIAEITNQDIQNVKYIRALFDDSIPQVSINNDGFTSQKTEEELAAAREEIRQRHRSVGSDLDSYTASVSKVDVNSLAVIESDFERSGSLPVADTAVSELADGAMIKDGFESDVIDSISEIDNQGVKNDPYASFFTPPTPSQQTRYVPTYQDANDRLDKMDKDQGNSPKLPQSFSSDLVNNLNTEEMQALEQRIADLEAREAALKDQTKSLKQVLAELNGNLSKEQAETDALEQELEQKKKEEKVASQAIVNSPAKATVESTTKTTSAKTTDRTPASIASDTSKSSSAISVSSMSAQQSSGADSGSYTADIGTRETNRILLSIMRRQPKDKGLSLEEYTKIKDSPELIYEHYKNPPKEIIVHTPKGAVIVRPVFQGDKVIDFVTEGGVPYEQVAVAMQEEQEEVQREKQEVFSYIKMMEDLGKATKE
jgi:uncharacterized coiled-coil protein SlyX